MEIHMPYLNVKLRTTPSQEITDKIAVVVADLTTEILEKKRELTAVSVEYVSPMQRFIAGA